MSHKDSAESAVRQIRRKTRRKYSAEEKIRIALEEITSGNLFAWIFKQPLFLAAK